MNLEMAAQNGGIDDVFRWQVEQRLRSGLRLFEPRIVRVMVSFLDLRGPYGAEQQCRLALSLTAGCEICVERRGASGRLALGRAMETALRELRRRFNGRQEPDQSLMRRQDLLSRK